MECRCCGMLLEHLFLDLGLAPPSNAYLNEAELSLPEAKYPLRLFVCEQCWLVQTEAYVCSDTMFTKDYAYFSSTSASWLKHALDYYMMISERLNLNSDSYVLEIACNDGYLLKNFVAGGIPCLGIEPTESTAIAAESLGIPVRREFFNQALAIALQDEGRQADLIVGNNVYAHVPDINDFTKGLKTILKPGGTITLEFPHLLNLIRFNQFDTVYHEHYSYLSLFTVQYLFKQAGLRVYDVEQLATHGGSLRVYGCHVDDDRITAVAVNALLQDELKAGLQTLPVYLAFQQCADKVKNDLLTFLQEQNRMGKSVAAYGAAAKGNTLLNYTGVKPDLLPFVCDAAAAKQHKFMPGSHIPILKPEAIVERRPDYVIILPWNIADEIIHKNAVVFEWGGRFVTAVPELDVMKKIKEKT